MKYRPEVDGLRALAVLPVILFHADFSLFAGGYVGVDVFFVISGYLITTIIVAELEKGTFSIVNFYERRARRILPALFFVMLLCLPFAWFWFISNDMQSFSQSLVAVSVFGSNILFWITSGYFDSASELKPLLHTWSLAIEEQFYVVFPLLLMAFWSLAKRSVITLLVLIALASFVAAHWGATRHPDATFYLLHTRAWELLVGSFIALYFHRRSVALTDNSDAKVFNKGLAEVGSFLGFIAVVLPIFTFDSSTPFPSAYGLLPVLGTAAIILFADQRTLVGKCLSSKWFVGVGLISYSAYLWHQPLFAFARYRTMEEPSVFIMTSLAVISLMLAFFSWKFIEAPFRDKTRFTRKHIFILSFIGSLFFIGVGLIGQVTEGKFFRTYDPVEQHLTATLKQRGANTACWRSLEMGNYDSADCVLGDSTKPANFALLGDSHAAVLSTTLNAMGLEHGFSGINYTYTNCPPIFGVVPVSGAARFDHCLDIRGHYQFLLETGNLPETLIVAARWPIYLHSEAFDNQEGGAESHGHVAWLNPNDAYTDERLGVTESIIDSIELMLEYGHNVILIYPIPEMGWNVPTRLTKLYNMQGELMPLDASTAFTVYQQRNGQIIEVLDRITRTDELMPVKVKDLFCDGERCLAHIANEPLYYDGDHLSQTGAKLLLETLLSVLSH